MVAWISPDYFESLLFPQLLRGENDSKQSDELHAILMGLFKRYFKLVWNFSPHVFSQGYYKSFLLEPKK